MKQILNDYKTLEKFKGETDYLAETCHNYKEIYHDLYCEIIEELCEKYNIDCNIDNNNWEDCAYISKKENELEEKLEKLLLCDFDNDVYNLTLKDIYRRDLINIKEKLLIPYKNSIEYNENTLSWYINGKEIVDELYYDCYSILHPKEIIRFVEDIIINELELNINNRRK